MPSQTAPTPSSANLGAPAAARDVKVLVDAALGQKVIDAINFPVVIQLPSRGSLPSETVGDADIRGVDQTPAGPSTLEITELGESFSEEILRLAQEMKLGHFDPALKKTEPEAWEAISAIAAIEGDRRQVLISNPSDDVGALIGKMLGKAVSVEVLWVKFEASKPTLTLGNPIRLSNVVVYVQAKIEACIKILGKKFCVRVTSPRVRIEGRQATIALASRGAVVVGTPRFDDVDIVIRVKIWKFTYNIRVGITGIVNAQLQKQGPVKVLDLSALEQDVPYSNKKLHVDAIDVFQDPVGMRAEVALSAR
jgi:hypothetical protein